MTVDVMSAGPGDRVLSPPSLASLLHTPLPWTVLSGPSLQHSISVPIQISCGNATGPFAPYCVGISGNFPDWQCGADRHILLLH